MPESLRPRFPKRIVDNEDIMKRKEYRDLTEMKRWYDIVSRVGWLGILIGDWMSPGLFKPNTSQAEFDRFVDFLLSKRGWLLDQLENFWPNAPEFLKIIGRIFPFRAN